MIHFNGNTPTTSASLYMTKLCRHFGHKIPVEFDEQKARAEFPSGGLCLMRAEPDALYFECQAPNAEEVARIRAVLEEHLVRFAPRETLQFKWSEDGDER